jgi:hypothetical protein
MAGAASPVRWKGPGRTLSLKALAARIRFESSPAHFLCSRIEFERSRMAIFRSRTAIQRNPSPRIAIRTAIQETRRLGYVPRRSGYVPEPPSWTTRALGKTSWASGKHFSRSDAFPRRRARQFPRRGALFSRWGGNQEPRARKSGIREAKAGAGLPRGAFSTGSSLPGASYHSGLNFNLDKKIAPLSLSRRIREPRSRRTGPLLRQACLTRACSGQPTSPSAAEASLVLPGGGARPYPAPAS